MSISSGTTDFSSPTALITGGSSGLGLACAREFVERGVGVCIVACDADRLASAADDLRASCPSVLAMPADIANPAEVAALREFVRSRGASVTYLLNVAGVGIYGPLASYTAADVEEIMLASLLGLIAMTQAFAPDVVENRGVICNVLSTAALTPRPNESVYCAAKYAARGFTDSIRQELKGTGVRIMAVYPGGMRTPFWDRSTWYADTSTFMDPSDVASVIVSNILAQSGCQITDLVINRP